MWLLAAACGLPAGCGPPVLGVQDVLVRPGEKAHLAAFVEREPVLGLGKDLPGVRVTFHAADQELAADKTDDEGLATAKCRLPAGSQRYDARATAQDRDLQAAGRVFEWGDERVIIAVDIDQTIARTEYKELLATGEEDGSDAVKRSAQTLRALAHDFHILYLTGRPRSLLEKTRLWLAERKFPDGPVIMAESVSQVLRPGNFKQKTLHALRKDWPTLRIGIGNRPSDADAYGANGMLPLVVPSKTERPFGRHALVFRDWKAVGQFFTANRDLLTSRHDLQEVIEGKKMLLRTVEKYQEH
jgi:hypothetical protein